MKKLIVFSTLTGNTEKIANAIFSEIKGDKEIFNVKETQNIDVNDYDKIIIGYWVDRGDADEVSKIFMSKIKNKTIQSCVRLRRLRRLIVPTVVCQQLEMSKHSLPVKRIVKCKKKLCKLHFATA